MRQQRSTTPDRVLDLVHAIQASTALAGLEEAAHAFGHLLGMETWAYGNVANVIVGNQNVDWRRHYPAGLHQMVGEDPLVRRSASVGRAHAWSLEDPGFRATARSPAEREALEIRRCHGSRSGISAPAFGLRSTTRNGGMLSYFSDSKRVHVGTADSVLPLVQLFGQYFHTQVLALTHAGADSSAVGRLTTREAQCLRLVADGYSSKYLSHALDLSMHTINFHLSNAVTKLRARNRSHAVALAIRMELI